MSSRLATRICLDMSPLITNNMATIISQGRCDAANTSSPAPLVILSRFFLPFHLSWPPNIGQSCRICSSGVEINARPLARGEWKPRGMSRIFAEVVRRAIFFFFFFFFFFFRITIILHVTVNDVATLFCSSSVKSPTSSTRQTLLTRFYTFYDV